ncbi:MAG TPA: hypothetical protein VMA36_12245 [Candidatus Limnocylindria bacterium]|nr:hypothetical protein [Candidatus Limnocylindria bacterium]
MMRFAAGGFALLAASFAWPTPLPTTAPAPRPTIAWQGAPAASFAVQVTALGVSPDGAARALVRVVLRDAGGHPTQLRGGGDFDFDVDRGEAQWQTRLRYGGPAAIVSVRDAAPVTVRVIANRPAALGEHTVRYVPLVPGTPQVVGEALGPHLVRIGWFPRAPGGTVRIVHEGRAALVSAAASSWDDDGVTPGTTAHYVVERAGGVRTALDVAVPPELPRSGIDAVRGKGAWLAFSGDARDDDGYDKLDIDQIVATAKAAGLRYVELRLAYGAFDQITPAARTTIDRLIDGLDEAGIAVVGWTVPRELAFDDLAENVAVARYRTPSGHGITGLAVDLERGGEFMGADPLGRAGMSGYLRVLREAVGPHVLLVATVEDPFLEHLDERAYPYAEIAAPADVLQPMTYWRMLGPWDSVPKVRQVVAGSAMLLRRFAGRPLPIEIGAQTRPLSRLGAPPADELTASVESARRAGAIGVIFYDWTGTAPDQWGAIAHTAW